MQPSIFTQVVPSLYTSTPLNVGGKCWTFYSITFISCQALCRLQAAFMCIFEFVCFISNLIKNKTTESNGYKCAVTSSLQRMHTCKHLYNLLSLVLLK